METGRDRSEHIAVDDRVSTVSRGFRGRSFYIHPLLRKEWGGSAFLYHREVALPLLQHFPNDGMFHFGRLTKPRVFRSNKAPLIKRPSLYSVGFLLIFDDMIMLA
jgi:hypothetical protein